MHQAARRETQGTTEEAMTRKLSDLHPLKRNPNRHTQRGLRALDDSIRQDGYTEPMVAAADGTVLSGNARLERVADVLGLDVDPIIVESDGTRPVVHIRTDIPSEDAEIARRIAIRANRVAQIDLDWDVEQLVGIAPEDLLTSLWEPEELSDLGNEIFLPDPKAQRDPVLAAEHFIEIYCSGADLAEFTATLGEWSKRDGVTINIS